MKLNKEANKETKKEARKMIEEAVKDIPKGQRLHFDKELLEQLLFETKELTKANGEVGIAKMVAWSGPFLSKIDLSEVSFDNVCWNPWGAPELYDDKVEEFTGYKIDDFLDFEDIDEPRHSTFECTYVIDLSNTNAKIDFSKSFNADNNTTTLTYSCNFENTDLSNNLITGRPTNGIYLIDKTNLSNTGVKINFTGKIGFDSNFSNLDLSMYEVNARDFVNSFEYCYFTNTGLKIQIPKIPEDILLKFKLLEDQLSMKEYERVVLDPIKKEVIEKDYFSLFKSIIALERMICEPYENERRLDGCCIEGIEFFSNGDIRLTEEQQKIVDKMKYKMFETYLQSMSEQTGKKGRR